MASSVGANYHFVTASKQKARGKRSVFVFSTTCQHGSVLGEQFLFMFSEELVLC